LGAAGLNSAAGLLIGEPVSTDLLSGFAEGSFILLLENISSCLDIDHRINVFAVHPYFIMKMSAG